MKIRRKRSFVTICLRQFFLYSILLLGIYILFNYWISNHLTNAFPTIDTLYEYQTELENDQFAQIDANRLRNCDFIIFDENGKVLYGTRQEVVENVSYTDLVYINDNQESMSYSVYQGIDQDTNQKLYYVTLYGQDDEQEYIIDECVLDQDLIIVSGTLFNDKQQLTKKEFYYLKGFYDNKHEITKTSYTTVNDDERTLVFISPIINDLTYEKVVIETNWLWLIAAVVILLVAIVQSLLFARKIKKLVMPLNKAIDSCQNGNLIVENNHLPSEFQTVLDKFRDLLERLKTARQEKEQLIVDISHDLKTPLTVVQGYAKAFIDNKIDDKQAEKYLRIMIKKADDAIGLINTLFDYVSMDHPKYQIELKQVELCETLKLMLIQKYNEIIASRFNLEVDIPDEPIYFELDTKLINRLLDNLISNSLKYNKEGTTIYVALKITNKQIIITIGDDGIGIDHQLASSIFEPFVMADKARTSGKGTGLGLSIAKKIVELHQGTIILKVPPDKPYHTQFIIVFNRK
ncbi:sensor histidine kinase KdpD [uncultured Thomasclavelia sp.]|uniref:sensor histidine kinase n=1 Tax=uncultured Thomasclavelia sp. TaxID=3025759 RepID=UPI0025CFFB9E|nr:HAMP domain-containing sensor histidine kinase [uncultured Thomasclavelia sp.]